MRGDHQIARRTLLDRAGRCARARARGGGGREGCGWGARRGGGAGATARFPAEQSASAPAIAEERGGARRGEAGLGPACECAGQGGSAVSRGWAGRRSHRWTVREGRGRRHHRARPAWERPPRSRAKAPRRVGGWVNKGVGGSGGSPRRCWTHRPRRRVRDLPTEVALHR